MDENWTIYALVFAAVFLLVQGIRGIAAARLENRRIVERFGTIDGFSQHRAEVELLKQRGSPSGSGGLDGRLRRLLVQSGTNLTLPKLGAVFLALSLGFF